MRRRSVVVLVLLVVFLAYIANRSPRRPVESVLPTVVILPTLAPTATPESATRFTPEFGLTMDIEPRAMYAQGEVVLRACPSRDCAAVGTLPDGAPVLVDGIINGEAVSAGNAIWYRSGSPAVYVYSEIVTDPTASAPISNVSTPEYSCNGMDDLECDDFHGGAQQHLLLCGDEDRIDADLDGVACEG